MATTVKELRDWLRDFDDDDLVGIDDDGLCLTDETAGAECKEDGAYIEVGGWPLEIDCSECSGEGRLENHGDFLGTETCPSCAGTGKVDVVES